MAAQTVAIAARLKVVDTFGDGERTSTELAAAIGTDAAATTQLCRALAALGILIEVKSGQFRLTETGALLRTGRTDSLHSFARVFTDPAIQAAWHELDTAVRTGKSTFDTVFGKTFFEYVAGDPVLSTFFPAALRQSAAQTAEALPSSYDFAAFETVADIGGGNGTVLAAILAAHPGLRGILYDSAAAVAQSPATLTAAGVADRCTVIPGDIVTEAPAGADLYLIKNVLHYADDERAVTVLGNIRRVIPPHGRLLIVDPALPETVDGSLPDTMYLSDLHMRLIGGGRGRTQAEFESLCVRAGFTVTELTLLPPPMAFSLIEAVTDDSHPCAPSGSVADSTAARRTFTGSCNGVSLLITTWLTTHLRSSARWPRCSSTWLLPAPNPAPSSSPRRPPRLARPTPSSRVRKRSSISSCPLPRAATASRLGTPQRIASIADGR